MQADNQDFKETIGLLKRNEILSQATHPKPIKIKIDKPGFGIPSVFPDKIQIETETTYTVTALGFSFSAACRPPSEGDPGTGIPEDPLGDPGQTDISRNVSTENVQEFKMMIPVNVPTNEQMEEAINTFQSMDVNSSKEADALFEKLETLGNDPIFVNRPFERLTGYERVLKEFFKLDKVRYLQMHKGTPFYFMAWLAFDLQQYKRAMFYLDAAVAEDVRRTQTTAAPDAWKRMSGAQFLFLHDKEVVGQEAKSEIIKALLRQFLRFNAVSGKQPVTMNELRRFVRDLCRFS